MNLSAVLGWACVGVPMAFLFALRMGLLGGLAMLFWMALLGLPIAFFFCWLVGGPMLWHVMRKEIGWPAAAGWGAAIALSIAMISIAIGRYRGWRQSLNPNSYSQIGGGDKIRQVDGILTPYGWWYLAERTVLFVLLGVAVALVIKWAIGAPETVIQPDETQIGSP
jgi:hypothetical protein